jgi:hypothetical protein
MKPLFRHCLAVRANRPRRLCWTCYYSPGVRERYPSESKFGRRGIERGTAALPAEPTEALLGTDDKIAVLEARCGRGESLFHPADAEPDLT